VTLKWNSRLARNITTNPEVAGPLGRELLQLGWDVARRAAVSAPRDSGEGAASIHPELFIVQGAPQVRVSWDRDHFYMGFQELGTVNQPARPFLRPAAYEVARKV
jgi:HK97 gp10 family phage protein